MAIEEELRALKKTDTWEISKLSDGKRPIGYNWIFTVKHKADRSIEGTRQDLLRRDLLRRMG